MSNVLSIKIVGSIKEAPNYRKGHRIDGHVVTPANLTAAIIVPEGTASGKPTVDLQFMLLDDNDRPIGAAVAMVTGDILKNLAAAITGVEERKKG